MHSMYKVEIEFGTEAPLYARRNYYVRSHEDVMALRAGAEGGMYRVGSATLEHIMSPAEVLTDIVVERVETSKAIMGGAA